MASLYAEVEIEASKERVWQVLIQKEQWKYWNTFLFDCDPSQPFQQRQEVSLSLRRLPAEEETEFQPMVTLLQPNICLKFTSSILGLKNEHSFELLEIGIRRTRYVHRDSYTGILSRFFLPFLREDELQGMRRMARELKRYSEGY